MKLSINILTWNTYATLHDTLHLLSDELKGIESEVIIVDNGSTDECKQAATIHNPKNLGISVGKNQGIDASKGEYILLLDGDIVPVKNSIRCLLDWLETHPECDAIGMHPNRFSNQKNNFGQKNHEEYCEKLFDVKPHKCHCIFYGMYRRTVFERGVRLDEGYGVGYGWEDLDSYMQMEKLGIIQWVAHINHANGKYYHEINSSIRQMGFPTYMKSSLDRSKRFKEKWEKDKVKVNA